MEQAPDEYKTYKNRDILHEMGAQTIGREIWIHIRFPTSKQLIQRRIILPLTEEDLSKKHGVVPLNQSSSSALPAPERPFARAIAGVLSCGTLRSYPAC